MSYDASATLYFGITLKEKDLRVAFGLPLEGDFLDVEERVEEAGFELIMSGNMVLGDPLIGVAVVVFEVMESALALPPLTEVVKPERLRALEVFLARYNIPQAPGWHLGATYG